ncbi:MAG: TIR domain-containing protein [Steroidobacterales bacterium]
MPAAGPEAFAVPRPTVFLSYASEDRRAAQVLRDALPAYGLEVWYDESDLVGGDAWDQKIRRQIRECDYFMPVISAHTEARREGYFRREWRLAVERTLDMADDHVFLLPVVIDPTAEAGARVPEKFRAVQWLRLADGQPTAALEAVCRRLLSGEGSGRSSGESRIDEDRSRAGRHAAAPEKASGTVAREFPPFPREEPGQQVRFWFQVAGWAVQSGWVAFRRLPKWARLLVYAWLLVVLVSRGCTPSHDRRTPELSAAQAHKLEQIGASHPGSWTAADTAQLISQVAKELPAQAADDSSTYAPALAIPFAAPADDPTAQKIVGSVFAQLYGRLALSRHGQVALGDQPLPTLDASAALAQGRAHGSTYVVNGAVAGSAANQRLTVKIIAVDDGSVLWSKSYAVTGADPAGIAAEVSARVPLRADD